MQRRVGDVGLQGDMFEQRPSRATGHASYIYAMLPID